MMLPESAALSTIAPVSRSRSLRHLLVGSAVAAGAVVLFVTLADVAFLPLHRKGVAQGLLGSLNGLSRTLQIPTEFVMQAGLPWRYGHRAFSLASWAVHCCLTFLFYFVLFLVLGGFNRLVNHLLGLRPPPPPPQADSAPLASPALESAPSLAAAATLSRRRFIRATKRAVVAGGAAVALGYPIAWEPRHFRVTRRSFALPGLSPELVGLRIVQLTDIHLGPWSSEAYVRKVVAAANARDADLLALTGDYVLHSPAYITPAARILAGLKARIGAVGVLGNHDWREGGPAMREGLAAAGVRMIDNARLFLTPDRQLRADPGGGDGLCVAGVGDLWLDQQFYDRALEGVPREMPRLLLSHNPDVAEERAFVSSGYRVDLMLSGHTHGGQVYIPGVGTPVLPSRYGQKYASGLVQGPACPVFISCGLGTALLPVRIGVPPEIAVIELQRGDSV
jgi:predicted MPP superfamily phosphohydrolase